MGWGEVLAELPLPPGCVSFIIPRSDFGFRGACPPLDRCRGGRWRQRCFRACGV